MISISMNNREFTTEVQRLRFVLSEAGKRAFMRRLGMELVRRIRLRFTTSGHGTWAPPSVWTKAKTGRRKPLAGLGRRIRYRASPDKVEVYFEAPSDDWDISLHHKGNTSPAVPAATKMFFMVRYPRLLNLQSEKVTLRGRGPSVTPARRIWLTDQELRWAVSQAAKEYLKGRPRSRRGGSSAG